ncbi:MAG: pantoate--beta-alanine ligase [Thermodesulfovibrio sp. RBG_19FT_COMBO_42_12]|nr:MAG: pantoate--beta-alanine ligase [Thermodesulfovibrio sp. RBG_19FT_COMBO_42_12]
MEIIRIPRIMQDTSKGYLLRGKTIGFVPSMGALHEGHLSLVRGAKQENDVTVVSIFVNPIQFGPSEDFKKYPRDIERDTEKLLKEETDILFMPDAHFMYPERFYTYVEVEKISEKLCGAFRPGHFRGVATVVTKLLNIVKPTRAYFGQKDFQQAIVIKQLVKDLDMDIDIVECPTIREPDGIAMSSRNIYLNERQRKAATVVYKSLEEASGSIKSGIINGVYIKGLLRDRLSEEHLISGVDYAGVYDTATLDELLEIKGEALLAIAVRIGDTRLIDNMLVSAPKGR